MPPKQKAKIVKDVTQLVLARRTRMCNFLEYKGALALLFLLGMNLLMTAGPGRLEGGVSAICVPVLRDGHQPDGQRTHHTGDNPQIRGGARPILWECALCVAPIS
jgi:hypothetical protein